MQQEFYIGQKVKTSQVGIERGCSQGEFVINRDGTWCGNPAYYVTCEDGSEGLFLPEEIEPIEDSIPHIVFDNIVKSL